MCRDIDCFFVFLAWFMIVSIESFFISKLMSSSKVIFVRMVNCSIENKYNLV